jgi:hypothetical protein
MNHDPDLTAFIKTNLKWITDVNGKWKSIKLLEDNIEKHLARH